MRGSYSLSAFSAGLLAAFVGFAGSFAVIIQGLTAVGASQEEAASGLLALSIAMGVCAIYLSLKSRLPISIAWSTPGVALLATSGAVEGGFPAAVGAFMLTSILIIVSGLWKPLGRWVSAIPSSLANAMLAGVLFGLCLAPVKAIGEVPALAIPIVLTWAITGRFKRLFAVPAAVLVAAVLVFTTTPQIALEGVSLWPQPVLVQPTITVSSIIGIALPLFIVTMASQNIPGLAVLHANGFHPPASPLFTTTGVFGLAATPFGGHAINLAAITAAICAGEEAHPDPKKRYWAAVTAGVAYVFFGLLAGIATAFISASPPILIEAVAGLALLGAFGSAVQGAVADAADREAAVITFLATASGLTFFGISGAFWGLVAGAAMLLLMRGKSAFTRPESETDRP